jgi:tRNA1(Val) A37 N6-methylase TrmN6
MAMATERAGVSEDAVLGGTLKLTQPLRGHRVGHDAILLAAATGARAGEHAVDLGAGVGAAGLALARRVAGVTVTLVEIEPALAALARENAARNDLAERVRVLCLDVAAPAAAFAAAGLRSGTAHRVLMNPPFNAAPAQKPSPDRGRRLAHLASPEMLGRWGRTAARLLRPSGVVTLIWRADGLDMLLGALAAGFGAVTLLPVHPKPGAAAIRVVARAVKGSRTPLALLPGLVLTDAGGKPSVEAEAILREGAALPLARE